MPNIQSIRDIRDGACTIRMLEHQPPHDECEMTPWLGRAFFKDTQYGVVYSVPDVATGNYHCEEGSKHFGEGYDGSVELSGWGLTRIPFDRISFDCRSN